MTMNSYQATAMLRDELAASPELGFTEEATTLMWGHDNRQYLVSLVLFDVTKEEV